MKILVVDDEDLLVKGIRFNLQSEGYEVITGSNGMEAVQLTQSQQPDLVVLDVMMPEMDGLTACSSIRAFSNVPIILLTAKTDDMDKLMGFDSGADDYLTKPFGVMELISRVKALLRRCEGMEDEKLYSVGGLVLDIEKHSVCVNGESVELTYKEYELLRMLVQNTGIVTSRETIMERIWGTDFEGESRTLDMHIKTLRQKLGEAGALIKTIRNVGYIIE